MEASEGGVEVGPAEKPRIRGRDNWLTKVFERQAGWKQQSYGNGKED